MRVIDKLAEITDSFALEAALASFTQITGNLADVLFDELPEDQRIAVRLVNTRGGVSKIAYTYLVKGGDPKPRPGSLVQVPAAFPPRRAQGHGVLWGIVQPDAGIAPPSYLECNLKYIVKWIHRYESA